MITLLFTETDLLAIASSFDARANQARGEAEAAESTEDRRFADGLALASSDAAGRVRAAIEKKREAGHV